MLVVSAPYSLTKAWNDPMAHALQVLSGRTTLIRIPTQTWAVIMPSSFTCMSQNTLSAW